MRESCRLPAREHGAHALVLPVRAHQSSLRLPLTLLRPQYVIHFGNQPQEAAEQAAKTIAAAHPDKPAPPVTALAKLRTGLAVVPTQTGSQLVSGPSPPPPSPGEAASGVGRAGMREPVEKPASQDCQGSMQTCTRLRMQPGCRGRPICTRLLIQRRAAPTVSLRHARMHLSSFCGVQEVVRRLQLSERMLALACAVSIVRAPAIWRAALQLCLPH